jgi:hypothetical protein
MAGKKRSQADVYEAMGISTSKEKENPDDVEYAKQVLKDASEDQKAKAREVVMKAKGGMVGGRSYRGYGAARCPK